MLQRRRRSREVLSATCTKRKRDRCQTVRRASVDLFQRHELKLRPRCECFASHDACFAAERSSSCKHPLQSESLFCSAALGIYKTTSFRPSQTGLRIVFARALALPGNLFSLQNCARAGHDVSIQKNCNYKVMHFQNTTACHCFPRTNLPTATLDLSLRTAPPSMAAGLFV